MASGRQIAVKAGKFAIEKALKYLESKRKHGDSVEKGHQRDEIQKVIESLGVLRNKEFSTAKNQIRMAFRLY